MFLYFFCPKRPIFFLPNNKFNELLLIREPSAEEIFPHLFIYFNFDQYKNIKNVYSKNWYTSKMKRFFCCKKKC